MTDNDDINRRFEALTSQIERKERRRMEKAWSHLPRYRRRRRWRITLLAAFVLVVAAGLVTVYRPGWVAPVGEALSARFLQARENHGGPVPEETEPVPVTPEPVSPFEGSPAKDYAEGVKGLTSPKARATGGLSRKDVATALKSTRDMLAATHLDRKTLAGGRPTALARLLPAEQREWFLKDLDNRKPKKGHFNTRYWVTSLAPKAAELATDVIKVNGRTKYASFHEDGRTGAKITVNYLFVYAVRRPGETGQGERIIVHSVGEVIAYRENGRLVVWPVKWNDGAVTGARCDVDDGFVHPYYEDSVPDKELSKATGAPVDPYELDREPREEECTLASRT
ncbi:hypothetical protein ABZ470_07225 [Streptosporangium sp. NPDC020072]|uniref:hypothetical protein n=1 Tax=Streptosporangium sp. NPDC020072 TaxID=3154788 RepID=UPI003427A143